MISELFIVIAMLGAVTAAYAFLYNDKENFTHIISGFLSGVVWIILGYQAYIGIEFQNVIETSTFTNGSLSTISNEVVLSSYQYGWLGMLFVMLGVIMILYSIVQAVNANKDIIEELEGKDEDIHKPVR